jgi:hypothetical protein
MVHSVPQWWQAQVSVPGVLLTHRKRSDRWQPGQRFGVGSGCPSGGGHRVLPGLIGGGCWPRVVGGGLPAALLSAVRGRGGSMSRDQGGKFWAERSGPR